MSKLIAKRVALMSMIAAVALLASVPLRTAKAQAPQSPAQPPAGGVYLCTASISYVPVSGTVETYERDFEVAVDTPFADDFSTPTREHVFTATATRQGDRVVIEVDYFSDVSVLNAVDLATSVTLKHNQRTETTSGRHQFTSSVSGSYTMTYTLVCRRS